MKNMAAAFRLYVGWGRISATFVEDRRNKGKNGKRCGENTALSSFQMECSFL